MHIFLKEKRWFSRKKKGYRDLVRRLYFGVQFVIFSMEIQNGCDYSMPIRVFNYDGSRYGKQLRKKRRKHREKKDLKGNEFLSGIVKTDRFEIGFRVYKICTG